MGEVSIDKDFKCDFDTILGNILTTKTKIQYGTHKKKYRAV